MRCTSASPVFYGPTVVRAAFVLAFFAWGLGFYGPPIVAHTVAARAGFGLPLLSAALTLHFVIGAFVVALLPRLHARWGLPAVTLAGACALAVGLAGWSLASAPWQLFVAVPFSGAGWVAMAAAPVNAIVSRWYAAGRPQALARAYNGASVGGVVFSPLLSWLIAQCGAPVALAICLLPMLATVVVLSRRVFARTPEQLGQHVDGASAPPAAARTATATLRGALLWRHRGLQTLALAMALSLFAQTGLVAHLYGLLARTQGVQAAGLLMGLATACAILGRTLMARLLRSHPAPRRMAVASYSLQTVGTLVLLALGGTGLPAIVCGMVLFGLGIGNATSLPPLVAQAEFDAGDTPRVVALTVALSQGTWAFAPLLLGAVLSLAGTDVALGQGAAGFLGAVAFLQALAAVAMAQGLPRKARVAHNATHPSTESC